MVRRPTANRVARIASESAGSSPALFAMVRMKSGYFDLPRKQAGGKHRLVGSAPTLTANMMWCPRLV